jgi:DNA ligase-associated metallophosphoesterase
MERIEWHDQVFWADPQRVLYWEQQKILLCADLHLGKTGHFRKEGIAVPQAIYQQDLQRLFAAISFHRPARVIMVGDLFHSRANKEWDWFGRWRRDFSTLPFTLILGNHDKLPHGLADELGLEVTQLERIGPIQLQHHPAHEAENEVMPADESAVISGHVHPSVIVPAGARQKVRLPCFYFGKKQCLLPAFSLFSGTHPIKPKAKDVVFAIAGQSLVQV